MTKLASSCLVMCLLAACGADPVSYSAPVGIELKAKSGDAPNGVIAEQKDITTESGNPYGAFVTDARTQLGGTDPSSIQLDGLTITLGAQSTGVASLDEIFTGPVDVLFLMNTSNNTYPAGTITDPTGTGPADLAVSFDDGQLGDDWAGLLGGQFKVVVRGAAATGFTSKGADATLQLTFTFAAFQ
jgi:hypothetical protein